MKSTLLRPSLLLAMVLALAGCGGKNTFDVTVYFIDDVGNAKPVEYSGLVLTNGSDSLPVPAKTQKIAFGQKIDYGTVYNVVVGQQPLHQNCVVSGATDTAGRMAAVSVGVNCTTIAHALTVKSSGLTDTATVVLTNGTTGGTLTLSVAEPTKSFGVTFGNAYGVSVLTQPTNGTICTVANGVGTMGDVDITNVEVKCAKP